MRKMASGGAKVKKEDAARKFPGARVIREEGFFPKPSKKNKAAV